MYYNSVRKWKIIDLDTCKIKDLENSMYYTVQYAAPELIRFLHEKTKRLLTSQPPLDIYACGIIAFELFASDVVFGNMLRYCSFR